MGFTLLASLTIIGILYRAEAHSMQTLVPNVHAVLLPAASILSLHFYR